ncbi:MAG: alanine--tRNA ligase, partial [Gammaproteobacteria bacterium]
MGLERLAAIMQGVHNNYDTDLFQSLIRAISGLAGGGGEVTASHNVIADHIRSCSFLITDGVLPSNEGRGYVLRRIIRRAARHGHNVGFTGPFFHKLVRPLVDEMGEAYPELVEAQERVEQALEREERRFAETLDQGMKVFDSKTAELSGKVIPGDVVFLLYDTYGFPPDLTGDIARERGLTLDMDGFEHHMEGQRERARAASQFKATNLVDSTQQLPATRFTGYDTTDDSVEVAALFKAGKSVEVLQHGEQGVAVLAGTPFYAESGGQVGDTGVLQANGASFEVTDTQKQGDTHVHIGRVTSGRLKAGDRVQAKVDSERRQKTVLNHSATHLLHAALRQVLGDHVQQKGSLVAPDRLRFDFSHGEPVKPAQLTEIERMVNDHIRANAAADIEITSMDDAMAKGALAFFDEKYGEQVRVLSFGDFSTELCGGTHVNMTGDIGVLKIVSETGVAAGVRRIEALTGTTALDWIADSEHRLEHISELVKGSRADADEKVKQLIERNRALEKELAKLKSKLSSQAGADLAAQAVDVEDLKVLAVQLDGADPKSLRDTLDQLKNKLGSAAIVLATVVDGKVSLVAGVTKDRTNNLKAGDLVNAVAQQVGGRGGGRPDMAQAGGDNPEALPAALQSVPDWVRQHMSAAQAS